MKSMLFHRLALSTDKQGILEIAEKGKEIQSAEDIIKDPYVFEFLGIPQQYQCLEGELEEKLILNLEHFLLELGKGFAFIGRQYKVSIGNRLFLLIWFFTIVFWNASYLLTWNEVKLNMVILGKWIFT